MDVFSCHPSVLVLLRNSLRPHNSRQRDARRETDKDRGLADKAPMMLELEDVKPRDELYAQPTYIVKW